MARLGSTNIDCRQDGAALDPTLGPRELSLQRHHRRHRAGRRAADRRRQSAPGSAGAQRAHPQALARRQPPDRRDRRAGRSHLSTTTISAPGRRRWPTLPRAHELRPTLQKAEQPLVIVGQGALARPDGAAVAGARGEGRASRSARSRTAGTAFRVLHTAASRVGALDLGFVPGEGGLTAAADGAGRRARCAVPARRRRDRGRARRLRRLYRHPWRPRRASRRRHPAGRGLYRRNPASTSTPKAACRWPARAAFPPGDAREDWAILRALSDVLGQQAALRLAARSCAQALFAAHPHLAAHRPDRAGRSRADIATLAARRRHARQGAVRLADRRISISPIRSRAPPPSWPSARRSPKASAR